MRITRRQLQEIIREAIMLNERSRVMRDMGDGTFTVSYEEDEWDVEEQARYDALNDTKDTTLYRDNPDYRDAFDDMQFDKDQRSSMGGDW